MPYIRQNNGQLIEVSQEQYDIYTVGQNLNPAAGGNVVQLNNTQTILTPNTTNNTPGQTTPTIQEQINAIAREQGVDPNAPLTTEQQAIVDAANRRVQSTAPQSPSEAANAVAAAEASLIPTNEIKTTSSENTGFVYNTNGELVPVDSVVGQEAIAQSDAALDQGIIDQANAEPSYYPAETDIQTQQRVQDQLAGESYYGTPYDDEGNLNPGWELDGDGNPYYIGTNTKSGNLWINPNTADSAAATRELARQQQTISQQRKQINNGDWRVRLRLAPQSKYLYNAPNPGILAPLSSSSGTDGIIFPYTPTIDTSYRANYQPYDLTHSNYRGYYYQNSFVDALNLRCTFTAQSTDDADYLLAVIHFLKSATKMFYGQDAERGSPPPVVYLTGLGQFQFNEHPCLIQQFNYSLPSDVDYIRARSAGTFVNLQQRRNKNSSAINTTFGGLNRLVNALLPKGGIPSTPAPATLGTNSPTYVPTKMDIAITLLPTQSRSQVSKQFSVKEFANGNLLKGGFW